MGDTRTLRGGERFSSDEVVDLWNSVDVAEDSFDAVYDKFVEQAKLKRKQAIADGRWKYDPDAFRKYLVGTVKQLRRNGWPLRLHPIPSFRGRHVRATQKDKVADKYLELIKGNKMSLSEVKKIIKENKKLAKSEKDKYKLQLTLNYVQDKLKEESIDLKIK